MNINVVLIIIGEAAAIVAGWFLHVHWLKRAEYKAKLKERLNGLTK